MSKETNDLICPGCGKSLDPVRHGEMVCDGEVWCDICRFYDRRLLLPRPFPEIAAWSRQICHAFGLEPVTLEEGAPLPPPSDPFAFLKEAKLLMAEAHHRDRTIVLYPPGLRLATLCHELAHLATGEDHTAAWAKMFAAMVAWVKNRLPEDASTQGMAPDLLGRGR
ncbi:MAG: hypothetical protein FJ128_09460 [Deltaproteobacteria bacterium]|nr:hypothetical protein [Deltaproteobacteria bacterium]